MDLLFQGFFELAGEHLGVQPPVPILTPAFGTVGSTAGRIRV